MRVRDRVRLPLLASLLFSAALGVQGWSGGHRARLSADLLAHEARHTSKRVRVIVHGGSTEIQALAARHHLTVIRQLDEAAVLAVNSTELSELAADGSVDHVSPDSRVRLLMSVSTISTGATQVRNGTWGLLGLVGAYPAVNGQGIGVAVLDSGISPHAALRNVVANVNFVTGTSQTVDVFGHGTHVAGIVGGTNAKYTSLYTGGIAPGAQIVNVRVLGPDGTGLTSDVIAGMEWAINNRARYNIRVINLSLGHPVTEPSATDPLCEEVAKATSLGIVVVAAAFAWLAVHFVHTDTHLSFTQPLDIDLGQTGLVLWAVLVIYATANAVNLTDGLDGLATGSAALTFAAFMIIAFTEFRHPDIYGVLPAQALDQAVVAAAMFGACAGFLWWNAAPARVFMGDTGSLAIGGAMAGLALLTRTHLLLPLLAGLPAIEALSVIAQVVSYRGFRKRVLRMAPIHHHFEVGGWSEFTVIVRFWLFGGICVALGVGIFYADFLRHGVNLG